MPASLFELLNLWTYGNKSIDYTIVPLQLDFAAEKGGMAVSAVWRLVYFLAPCPSEPKEQTTAHRRDALCPSTQIQNQAALLVSLGDFPCF